MYQSVELLVPLFGIVFGTLMPILIVWLILRFRGERDRLIYDTAVKLAEKGQPVPPELFSNINQPSSDLRRGLVLALVGMAISISLYEVGVPWTFGLIPAFAGLGYLVVWWIERSQQAKSAS